MTEGENYTSAITPNSGRPVFGLITKKKPRNNFGAFHNSNKFMLKL